jgi:hypothetical protein
MVNEASALIDERALAGALLPFRTGILHVVTH